MFQVSASAALVLAICVGWLFLFSVTFAFQETCRGFRNLFAPSLVRNFLRTAFRRPPQFSLAALLIVATVAPPLSLVVWDYRRAGLEFWLLNLGYSLVIVGPLVYWFYVEAFGPGPRARWRKLLAHQQGEDADRLSPRTLLRLQQACSASSTESSFQTPK